MSKGLWPEQQCRIDLHSRTHQSRTDSVCTRSLTDRYIVGDWLENKEYKLGVKYNLGGGGPKMLLGETNVTDLPPTLEEFQKLVNTEPDATNPQGRVGEVYPNFGLKEQDNRYVSFKFYGTFIYAPSNAEEILQAGYGKNCLTHVIEKYHDHKEFDLK